MSAKKKQQPSVESLPEPKLSPDEAAKVKGGLISNLSISPTLSPTLSPIIKPGPIVSPTTSPYQAPIGPGSVADTCSETGDTGMMGCPG